MGLISTEVEVNLCGATIKRYESLGYQINRIKNKNGKKSVPIGSKIMVKVEDLPDNSAYKVLVKCDLCGEEKKMAYRDYKKSNHNGKYYCQKCANKIRMSGENNHNYNHLKTEEERIQDRKYDEYTEFVKKVLARDNYTCVSCGKNHDNKLEVHHLDGYNWCKEKRTLQSNGVTLCNNCHKNFHAIYGFGNNTEYQFKEWLKNFKQKNDYNKEVITAKQVYVYEDDIIFDSAKECSEYFNCRPSNIYLVCNRKSTKATYKKVDGKEYPITKTYTTFKGKHLFWLHEYEKMSEEELKSILYCSDSRNRRVICLNTLKVYNLIKDVKNDYNIDIKSMSMVCSGRRKSLGKDPITNEPLRWMYYKDYLELQKQEELNKKEVI